MSGLHLIADAGRAAVGETAICEARVREIVREEIAWALQLSGRSGSTVRAAADRRRSARRDQDEAMAADYASGLTMLECATKYGCSTGKISAALHRTETPVRPKGPYRFKCLDPDRLARMIEQRGSGSTLLEIAAEHGVTRERVRQILNKAGVDTHERPITAEQKEAVEEYIRERGNLLLYAARFGVSKTTFRNWVLRCGHVPHKSGNAHGVNADAIAVKVAELYLGGASVGAVAKALNFGSQTTVYRYLARAGIKPRGRSAPRGRV